MIIYELDSRDVEACFYAKMNFKTNENRETYQILLVASSSQKKLT